MRDPLAAAGALRADYDRVDWSATPLGDPSTWGPALRSAVDLALNTRFAVTLFWGPEFTMVYNEAYVRMIDDKHPSALGARAEDVFPELWDVIDPLLRSVRAGEGATWSHNQRLFMNRRGFAEETYFTFSYSALTGDDGEIVGAIDIAAETTGEVLDRRRLELLRRLGRELSGLDDPARVVPLALEVLRTDPADLPAVEVHTVGAGDGAHPAPSTLTPGEIRVDDAPGGGAAWLVLGGPSRSSTPHLPTTVLGLRLSPHLGVDEAYRSFLQFIATTLTRAVTAATAVAAERAAAAAEHELSETLQRALLTTPVHPADLDVAVRYQPSAEQAKVGGDWYDAFVLPDGTTTFVVGDVTGHDRFAAAAMGQIRNLIRGISYASDQPPSRVLEVADRAMRAVTVGAYATSLVAQVGPGAPDGPGAADRPGVADGPGARTLTWSNAGHLPPVLIAPDGRARLLTSAPEALLGLRVESSRTDHCVALEPGSTLVLYTDGLVERRNVGLDAVQHNLVAALDGHHRDSADEICRHLLAEFDGAGEDDVALIAVRVR